MKAMEKIMQPNKQTEKKYSNLKREKAGKQATKRS